VERSLAPANPGRLYPLGIIVVYAAIALLGVVAAWGDSPVKREQA
jgi:hypothetical protein